MQGTLLSFCSFLHRSCHLFLLFVVSVSHILSTDAVRQIRQQSVTKGLKDGTIPALLVADNQSILVQMVDCLPRKGREAGSPRESQNATERPFGYKAGVLTSTVLVCFWLLSFLLS